VRLYGERFAERGEEKKEGDTRVTAARSATTGIDGVVYFFATKTGASCCSSLQKLVTGADRSPTIFAGRRAYADGRRRSSYSLHHGHVSVVFLKAQNDG